MFTPGRQEAESMIAKSEGKNQIGRKISKHNSHKDIESEDEYAYDKLYICVTLPAYIIPIAIKYDADPDWYLAY